MKKNFKIIVPLVLLVAVLGAWYAYREYNRKPASMENEVRSGGHSLFWRIFLEDSDKHRRDSGSIL